MRIRRFVARATTMSLLAAVAAVVTAASPVRAGPSPAAAGSWVTLITGDRVRVAGSISVEPARRARPAQFQQFTRRGDRYVVPADAALLIRAGTLDLELFNVTGLVRQGYDDARTSKVPLLVRGTAATGVRRALPGARMAAVDADKGRNGLADLAGAEKIWLNGRVTTKLDESVARIGAPAAWAAGVTGRGVTVAVLDTGVDTDHPDLAGRVGMSKDFSGKGSVEDGNGHGTHVASTVAGSGAASGGRYRGVAPDATLAVGKVLGDDGSGQFDAIIAGMQWAAGEAHADVVNMSLGGGPSDGADPMSAAVDELTGRYGTLFVVAAGNDGADESVSSPAAASSALAVGSVSKSDVPSEFSSRGPRYGDGAVKPEIAAPGEGIVAAAPAGVPPLGEPTGDAYQRLDGTSMATPHVAGSAALLAQLHPDWSPDRLKDALMSTAVEVPGAGVPAVGAGRVDVARATGQAVTATGGVSAYLKWPNHGASATKPVTWRNTGSAPVTLALELAVPGAPAGLVTLSTPTVTVPAGGSSTVDVRVAAVDGRAGTYGGVLVARSGGTVTRTALSVRQEEEMYDLTVGLLDRDGNAPVEGDYPTVVIVDLDHDDFFYWGLSGTVRLPAGRYAVNTRIETPRAGREPTYSLISHPELRLDRNVTQTFDARTGQPVSITVDDPAARGGAYQVELRSRISDCGCWHASLTLIDPRLQEMYAATVPGASSSTFVFAHHRRALEPTLELFADDGQRFEVGANWLDAAALPPADERLDLPAVYGGQARPEDLAGLDVAGALVVAELPADLTWDELIRRTRTLKDAGARLALVTVAPDPKTARTRGAAAADDVPALPTLRGYGPTADRLVALAKRGRTTVTYGSKAASAVRYELAYVVRNALTTAQDIRPRTADLAAVRTAYHDNVDGYYRQVVAFAVVDDMEIGGGWSVPAPAGRERTEYFTPGRWDLSTAGYWGPRDGLRQSIDVAAGRPNRVVWNKAVAGPVFPGTVWTRDGERPYAWRDDDAIDVILPLYGDAAGHPRVPFVEYGTDTGSISLYRDGALVGTVPVPDAARFAVPTGPGTYRLVAETSRAVDWWPLWTKVSAAWTFRSSAAANGRNLPLLTARFDPAVDLRNRAPGGRAFTIPVRTSAAARSVTVDVSYDDGRTWHKAAVRGSGEKWTASVRHPRSGYASFRTTAVDVSGNRLEQTVVRAYEIG